jgi:Tol biopolymer transport system component
LDLKTALLWAAETSAVVDGPAATSRGRLGWIAAGLLAVAALGIALWAPWRAQKPADRPLMRLDLDLGPGRTMLSQFGPDVVLSPDGARLAWLSQNRLFTRRLDQPVATELAGTEGASGPFFSPDGQWIAFAAGGKLKKISVAGSSAVTLCDAPLFLGGSWGEDGSIVAALTLSGGLFRILSAGGAAVPLTKLDAERGERTHRWPQILPGGRAVVFTSHTNSVGGFDDAGIEAVSLADGRRKTLVKGGAFGRYLEASRGFGYLTYVNRGTLFAVPLDPMALEVRGPAVPILEQVGYNSGVGTAKLDTSQSGALIYENGESGGGLVTLQWLEEGGKTQPIIAKPGNYGRPSLSPDGRRLALEVLDGSNSDIWVQDLERDTMTRLTFDGKGNLGPVWTPDGHFIVFQDPRGLSWARADGSGKPQSLLRLKGAVFPWSFTPDGRNLAYIETVAGTYDLWSVPIEVVGAALQAGKPEDLRPTPFDERAPVFSPDGRWLAWVSNESGNYEVYVRALPEAASGGGKWQISSGGASYPMWSRTGHQLFFESLDNRIMVAAYATSGNSFAAEKPKLWSEKQLSNLTNTSRNIDLAPDGKRFAVILPVEQPGSQTARSRVTLVENFADELRRRVPPGK